MMKKLFAILVACALCGGATGATDGYGNRVRYWYSQNVSTNVPDISDIIAMRVEDSGSTVFKWKITNAPTVAELDAPDAATVDAWIADVNSNRTVLLPNVNVPKHVAVGSATITSKGNRIHVERLTIDSEDDSGGIWSDGDVEVAGDTRGLLLKSMSTNNATTNTWLYVPDDAGRLMQVLVAQSPMIPYTQRVARVQEKIDRRRKTRKNWNGNGQLQARLEQIEKLLGLRPLDQ